MSEQEPLGRGLWATLVLLLSVGPGASFADVTDSEFLDFHWTHPIFVNSPSGAWIATAGHVDDSGNPGAAMAGTMQRTGGSHSPYWNTLYMGHLCELATYDPSTQGPLASVSLSLDIRVDGGSGGCGDPSDPSVGFRLIVRQNADYFTATGRTAFQSEGWVQLTTDDIAAPAFDQVLSDGTLDETSHPDFSTAGSLLEFGFASAGRTHFAECSRSWKVDNFRLRLQGPMAGLVALVSSLDVPPGIQRSLLAKLEAAERAIERGNERAAMGSLRAFVNHVRAQRGKHIQEADADVLMDSARAIIGMLGADGRKPVTRSMYMADTNRALNGGLGVDQTEFHLTTITPNPFSRSATIRYELTRSSVVNLAIYDVRGRLVRALQSGSQVGPYTITWDGRDGSGLRVAGGTYFVRLTAGDVTQTRKVVFIGAR